MKLPIIEVERIKHDISKDELPQLLGVSKRTIANWQISQKGGGVIGNGSYSIAYYLARQRSWYICGHRS